MMDVYGRCIFGDVVDCVLSGLRRFRILAERHVSIELFHAQVPQRCMPEKILLRVIQKIERIWIFRVPLYVNGISSVSVSFLPKETCGYEHAWASGAHDMKAEESVEGHTNSHGPGFQP